MENKAQLTSGIQYSPDLVTHHDQLSAVSEAFKIARTNIEFSSIDSTIHSLMVTSSTQTEGKTVTLANLAIAYAQMGRKVLLVDADLRRPAVHRYFGYVNRRGLTNVLIGAGHYRDFILPTLTENLSILPAGPVPPNPADLLMSQTMTDLLEVLEQEYDLVLVDCPPVGAVTDAAIVSTKVNATIFVVRAGQTNKRQLKRSVALLEQVNARVLGFIMNGVSEDSDDYYYYYQQYYYQSDPALEGDSKRQPAAPHKKHHQQKPAPAQSSRHFTAAPLVRQANVPIANATLLINNKPLQSQTDTRPESKPDIRSTETRPLRSLLPESRPECRSEAKPEIKAVPRHDSGSTLISDDD